MRIVIYIITGFFTLSAVLFSFLHSNITMTKRNAIQASENNMLFLENQNERLRIELDKHKKTAYLTFDDGPSINTIKVLDILKKEKIKGTFFVNGNDSKEAINIYKRIVNEGHAIGNHTYSHHYQSIYASANNYIKDFNRLEKLLLKETGVAPKLYRFPGGSLTNKNVASKVDKALSKKGYIFYDWNIDSKDSAVIHPSKEYIIQNVKEQSKGKKKAIILFHDTKAKKGTVEALPTVIKNLKKDGYEFDVLSEHSFNYQFIKK